MNNEINPNWSDTINSLISEVADNTLKFTLGALSLAGLLLLGATTLYLEESTWILVTSLMLFLVVGLGWVLLQKHYRAASWSVVVGMLVITVRVIVWGKLSAAICLLAVDVGLAAVLLNRSSGIGLALVSSLCLLFLPQGLLPVDAETRMIALVLVVTVIGLLLLVLRPLLLLVRWVWFGYEQSTKALKMAQEYQVKLLQTVEEMKNANEQLNRLNQLAQNLRQSAEEERMAKEQFVANVSHELRTPLNMIIGFSEMITRKPELYGKRIKPALLADLNVVLRNSQHLASLIDDILDLSKIDANQMAISKERVSIAEIVETAVAVVSPLYQSKGLTLEAEVEEELPVLLCDRTRIREVLINLLSNAGRFTEQGGVHVQARRGDGSVTISVSDTGPGIAPEDQDRVFEPFQQVDGTIRRRYSGTGLGLSISKKFVELHGGRMWVESQVGKGARFTFSLPFASTEPVDRGALRWFSPYLSYADLHTREATIESRKIPARLVVVERGDSLQKLVHRYMDEVEVFPAASLEEAVAVLEGGPALALVINEMDVDEGLRALNALPGLPYGIPAIVCSVPGSQQAAREMGVTDYLVKPVSQEALLHSLGQLGEGIVDILLIDDEQDALQLFGRMLGESSQGFRVVRAVNGRQALDILHQQGVDAILMDLMMPDMNGFQLLAALKQDAALCRIPIILISAQDPFGHPIVSSTLAVTARQGLSSRDVLECIQALSMILSKTSRPAGPTPAAELPE